MIFQWDNNITRFICLSPCWSLFLRVSGASGACWMGRRPSHCGKQPAGAQHHTHCSRRADEQPTGGTQLWGTNTHITHHLSTSLCWELPFVTNLYCPLLLQAKVSPNFKSNYSETLAKLEHQYCKLLVSLTLRAVVLCAFEATLVSSVHPLPQ